VAAPVKQSAHSIHSVKLCIDELIAMGGEGELPGKSKEKRLGKKKDE